MRRQSSLPFATTVVASTALFLTACTSGAEISGSGYMPLPTAVPIYTPVPAYLENNKTIETSTKESRGDMEIRDIRYEFTLNKGGYVEIMDDRNNGTLLYVIFHPINEEEGDIAVKYIKVSDNGNTDETSEHYSNELYKWPFKVSFDTLNTLNFDTPNGIAILDEGTKITISPEYVAVISIPEDSEGN